MSAETTVQETPEQRRERREAEFAAARGSLRWNDRLIIAAQVLRAHLNEIERKKPRTLADACVDHDEAQWCKYFISCFEPAENDQVELPAPDQKS